MPSGLYTISFKATRGVVALCSLDKKHLADQAAWDQLRTALVGARFPISMAGGGAPLEIAASRLGCDLVRDLPALELASVLADPYRYRVSLEPAGPTPAEPGDGKEKILAPADTNAVETIELIASAEPRVQVTLAREPPRGLTGYLLFEGQEPLAKPTEPASKDAAGASNVLVFDLPLGLTITAGTAYAVMVFLEGAPIEARKVTAAGTRKAPAAPQPVKPPRART